MYFSILGRGGGAPVRVQELEPLGGQRLRLLVAQLEAQPGGSRYHGRMLAVSSSRGSRLLF